MNPVKFYISDPWLKPFTGIIDERIEKCELKELQLKGKGSLAGFAMGHHYYGLHNTGERWIFREWAPNASDIFITGTFNGWKEKPDYRMQRINEYGDWEINLPSESMTHCDLFKLSVHWPGGKGERIPSYAARVVQDDTTKIFSAQVWNPAKSHKWQIIKFKPAATTPVIYEAHVGMATHEEKTGTYNEFTENIIPLIAKAGYN
ncbi:MAG: 1,4-alpha-glucan-branching enzyme, partial [Acidobacteriales bacterium]